ncbi:MAG: signal peptidase I [Nocardioidaceae bacterium]
MASVSGDRSATTERSAESTEPAPRPIWWETVVLVGTALVLALVIKTFFVQAFYIPSGSMRETLQVDDRILVEKMSYWFGDVQRGDIVVFDDPADWLGDEDAHAAGNALTKAVSLVGLYPSGGHLVKRVIGVAGDAVSCAHGTVAVNGVALEESAYVTLAHDACTGHWAVDVPDDRLWVLGDNREHSADSRVHTGDPGGGFIPVEDVVGKVLVVVWPTDRWQFLHRPGTFADRRLDNAASLVSDTAPVGLASVAALPLYRRWKNRKRCP